MTCWSDLMPEFNDEDLEVNEAFDENLEDEDNSIALHLYLFSENAHLKEGCKRILYGCYTPQELNTGPRKWNALKVIRKLAISLYKTWEEDPSRYNTISLNNNHWVKQGRYGKLGISGTVLRKTITRLEEKGFIDFIRGDQTEVVENRKQSKLKAKPKLIDWMLNAQDESGVIASEINEDINKYLSEGVRPRAKLKDINKKLVDIKRKPSHVVEAERLLESYQAVLDRTEIINPETGILQTPYDKFQYRSFSRESFDLNGRVHGGFWQRIKSEQRRYITLDGEPTLEVDFKGTFPSIVYHFLSIDFWAQFDYLPRELLHTADPYYLEGYTDRPAPLGPSFRDALKLVFNSAINVKYSKSIHRRLSMTLKTNLNKKLEAGDITRDAFDAINAVRMKLIKKFLYEKHHLLKDYYFNAEIGMLAMNAESRIALEIIRKFTSLGKPILTIYDGFIVKREDKTLLTESMVNCYYQIFGFHPFYKVIE
jgi:hypothetical protein